MAVGCAERVDVGRTASNSTGDSGAGAKGNDGAGGKSVGISVGGSTMTTTGNAGGAIGESGAGGAGALADGSTGYKAAGGKSQLMPGSGSGTGSGATGSITALVDSSVAWCASQTVGTVAAGMTVSGANGYSITILSSMPSPAPSVGVSEWLLYIHDLSGRPVDGAALTFRLYMPTMGHGSPISPSSSALGSGRYDATDIAFSMPGYWTVTIGIDAEGGIADSVTFPICVGDAPATDSGPPLTCDQRTATMQSELDAVLRSADTTCTVDGDCALAPSGNRCFGVPCATNVVSQTGLGAISAELSQIDAKECDAYFGAGCAHPPAYECPAEFSPKCDHGTCVQGNGQ